MHTYHLPEFCHHRLLAERRRLWHPSFNAKLSVEHFVGAWGEFGRSLRISALTNSLKLRQYCENVFRGDTAERSCTKRDGAASWRGPENSARSRQVRSGDSTCRPCSKLAFSFPPPCVKPRLPAAVVHQLLSAFTSRIYGLREPKRVIRPLRSPSPMFVTAVE